MLNNDEFTMAYAYAFMFEMFEFSGYFDTSGYATTRGPAQSPDVLYPCTTLVIVYDLGLVLDRLDEGHRPGLRGVADRLRMNERAMM